MNTAHTSHSPWFVLVAGTLFLLALEYLGIWFANTYGSFATFFFMLFGGAILAGLASRWLRHWAGIVYCIAFFAVLIVGFSNAAHPLWQRITGGSPVTPYPIDVANAPAFTNAVLTFSNGSVRTNLTGTHLTSGYVTSRTGGSGYTSITKYIVAPFVDASWEQTTPIRVWVLCTDTWKKDAEPDDTWRCQQEWGKGWRVGVRIDTSRVAEANNAIADATATHQLLTDPNAVIVTLHSDTTGAQIATSGIAVFMLVLGHGLYVFFVLRKWNAIPTTSTEYS